MLNRPGPEIERYQQITGLIILQEDMAFQLSGHKREDFKTQLFPRNPSSVIKAIAGWRRGMPMMAGLPGQSRGSAGCLLLTRIKVFGNLIQRWGR